MKKTLVLLLVAILVALSAFGCAPQQPVTPSAVVSTEKASSTPAAATAKPQESAAATATAGAETAQPEKLYPLSEQTVTYTMLNPSSVGEKWSNLRLFKVMEQVTNVRFEFSDTPSGDYTTRQNLLLASGSLPDVLWNALDNNNIQTYGVEGKMLLDIAPLMRDNMPHMMAMLEQYPLALVGVTEMNGGVYVLPKVSVTATETGETLFVRTDMLGKVNKEVPKTVEELYDALVALKDANFSAEFVPFLPSNMNTVEVYLFPSFGEGIDPGFADAGDGKTVVFNTISDQFKLYLEYVSKLYAEGLLEKEIYSMDSATITAKLKANNAAVMTAGTSFTLENFESGTYDVEIIPPMTSQHTTTQKIRGVPYEKIGGVSISAKTKNPEILLKYFDIWFSEEDVVVPGLNGISTKFGIYGEDWEYLNDEHTSYRRIVPADTTLTEEEWRIQNVAPSSQPPAFAVMTAVAVGNPAQTMKGEQCVKNLIPFWQERFPLSFLKLSPEENDVVSNKLTDINTYVNSMKGKFITGAEPLSKWDEFVSTVNAMGIQDVLTAYQAAYDRLNVTKASLN